MEKAPTVSANLTSATRRRPLLGLTVLVVEDSRYACEALRLMCLRSGARIRRADCLKSARKHLQLYRPSVAVIDIGLPDGSGVDLIEEASRATPRIEAILGMSGDDLSESTAIAAGADAFVAKPLRSLAAFQEAVLSALPAERRVRGPRLVEDQEIDPDPIAYRDDIAHAQEILCSEDDSQFAYVTQFLGGISRSAGDHVLSAAVDQMANGYEAGTPCPKQRSRVSRMLNERLSMQAAQPI